jgi:hypothetical protein
MASERAQSDQQENWSYRLFEVRDQGGIRPLPGILGLNPDLTACRAHSRLAHFWQPLYIEEHLERPASDNRETDP